MLTAHLLLAVLTAHLLLAVLTAHLLLAVLTAHLLLAVLIQTAPERQPVSVTSPDTYSMAVTRSPASSKRSTSRKPTCVSRRAGQTT